jgi:hypothetical protein
VRHKNFVSCKPRAEQKDIRLQAKISPRFKFKNLKAAFLFRHMEFGPFG